MLNLKLEKMYKKITSVNNEIVKDLVKLNDKKNISNLALVESEKVVFELLNQNKVNTLYIEEKFLEKTSSFSVPTFVISKEISKKISSVVTPSGIFATVNIPKFEELNSNFLVLENLQDPSNLGAIFRTALASNYKTIYLINSVCPYLPKVTRGSMGYNFKLNIKQFSNFEEFISFKNEKNLFLISANLNGENIFNYDVKVKPFGIVIGNEGNGVSSAMQSICNDTVTIPMQNDVESLNAGISASLLMYLLNNKL